MRCCSPPIGRWLGPVLTGVVAFACSAGDPALRGTSGTQSGDPSDPSVTDPSNTGDQPGTPGDPSDVTGGGGGAAQPGGPGVVPTPAGSGPNDPLAPGQPGAPGVTEPASPGTLPAGGSPAATPTQGEGVGAVSTCVDPTVIGATPIRRISAVEYANAVRDVFGAVVNPGDLPADERLGAFTTNVASPLVRDNVDRYFYVGRQVSAEVVADFAARSGCTAVTDTACVDAFLESAARRAFHGTLEPADAAHLADIRTSIGGLDAALGVQTAIEFILSSPRFLFLVEFGGTGTATMAPLSGSEVAGRLAAFLWRSVPDAALLQAADAGSLATPEGVRAQAATMLADARAVPVLRAFANEWLRIGSVLPGASALDAQIGAQPGDVMALALTDPSLSFQDLLTGTSAPLGAELASFYGVAAGAALPPERQGLLLSAGFLRSNSSGTRPSPVKRGFVVRRSLLCETIPPPTDPLAMQLPEPMEGVTERAIFNQHSADPTCWACHKYMDPLGDAFGAYDATGAYAPEANDTTAGTVYFTGAHDPPEVAFTDTQGLLQLLATDASSQQCFILQVARFALGRGETSADACGVEAVTNAVAETMSVQQLLLEVAGSTMFLNRNPVVAGGTCR